MSRQKAITAFCCEKYGNHVQHNQCTSSESVNLAASAEPVDLDEDYSILTADSEPTLAKRRKLIKGLQGNNIVKHQCKFIIWPSCSLTLGNSHDFYNFNIVALDRLIFILVLASIPSAHNLKTCSRTSMANARLNGLALAYIHKPTEIDSSSVLKRWDAFGQRWIALAFGKE